MKKFQLILGALLLLITQTGIAKKGLLFNVIASGTPAEVSITLCLNGRGPLSCQNYIVSALTLSITTTIPNHNYPGVGIKVNTPGYTIQNSGVDCTVISNGYCLFSVSNTTAKTITIQKQNAVNKMPLIAAGLYSNGISDLPFLASNIDSSFNWIYSITATTPTLPLGAISGEFVSASCSGINCVAAGYYRDGSNRFPLLANSVNGGVTWNYSIDGTTPALSVGPTYGQLKSVSCSGLNCIAAGYYNNVNNYPLLANSTDGGASWSYSITSTNLPSGIDDGQFNSASCSGRFCIAAGYYSNGINQYPLLVSSNNGGVNWTYSIDASAPALPALTQNGEFVTATCDGLNCLAAGNYNNLSGNFPLLANSITGGGSWSYSIDASSSALPPGTSSGRFNSVSCNGTTCIAAGRYIDGSNGPLLVQSSDGGVHWDYRIYSGTPTLPPSGASAPVFLTTSCSNNLKCVAAGTYSTIFASNNPLLANSIDGGFNWVYSIYIGTAGLPSDSTSGSLNSVSCDGLNCIAGGIYSNLTTAFPLLSYSIDGGVNWIVGIDANNPALPTGLVRGEFKGTGIGH